MRDQATREVLDFWFGQDPKRWWMKDASFDSEIKERFGKMVELGLLGQLENWQDETDSILAYILVLDQFTRNIYRGTPKAFAGDSKALSACKVALRSEWDKDSYTLDQKLFLYLPLEHSEELADQERMVELCEALCEDAEGEAEKAATQQYLDYAIKHRDVIARFGRFPHRNEILERKSTPEELDFLEQPGSRF